MAIDSTTSTLNGTPHDEEKMTQSPNAGSPEKRSLENPAATSKDEEATPSDDSLPPFGENITGYRWVLICLGIFSVNLLYGLDTTIAADIQAPVAETFNEIAKLGWLGVGFTLGSVAVILPLGKAYAIFDTKWLFIGSVVMFEAGSALCGGAPSMNAIIIGRVWAGAGGAGMYLGNINLITYLTPPKDQPRYIGYIGFVYGTGCILGPIIGGLFSDSPATWRWAFYINLLIFAVVLPIYLVFLPPMPRRPETTFMQRIKVMDWAGILVNTGLYVSFVLFVTFGGTTWAWSDGRTIACIVVFAVCLITFTVLQVWCIGTNPSDRLFPCEMVVDKTMVLLYIVMAAGGAALFVAIYYIPLYFQFVNGDTGTESAVRLLPFVCFYVVTVVGCGRYMAKTGYYAYWFLVSGIFMTVGAALMYTVRRDTPVANIYGYTIILGIGMTTTQAGYGVGPEIVPSTRVPECLQFLNISQGQSQLLGLAIASAIFQSLTFNGLHNIFASQGFSDDEIREATAGARSRLLTQSSPEVRDQALDVIVSAISNIYIMAIAAGALYTICSVFLPKTPRRRA